MRDAMFVDFLFQSGCDSINTCTLQARPRHGLEKYVETANRGAGIVSHVTAVPAWWEQINDGIGVVVGQLVLRSATGNADWVRRSFTLQRWLAKHTYFLLMHFDMHWCQPPRVSVDE
eukprot:m.449440 g.449440  ORF g.449440 m.449440 type:complete len:117 (+) comp21506_c1_seq3:94-444(+)